MESKFSRMLHESTLDGLQNVLGESGMKVVLLNTELDRYANSPEELHRNLYNIFKEGAFVLEKVIVKELFQKLSVPYEEGSNFDFAGHVNYAKKLFVKRQKELVGDQKTMKRKSLSGHTLQPHLKIIRALWRNSPQQVSFVVVDLNGGQKYPQNFVCVFPKNLFRRNQKGNLKRSRFFHIFGEKTYEMARNLLEGALKRETDPEIRRQIGTSLREVGEVSQQQT